MPAATSGSSLQPTKNGSTDGETRVLSCASFTSRNGAVPGAPHLPQAFPTTTAQNEQRKTRRLTLPVLAIGGAESSGAMVADTMKLVADDVQGVVLNSAHWVAEQAPEELLAALTEFLAPYRAGVLA